MKTTYLIIRSVVLWILSWINLIFGVTLMIIAGTILGQRRTNFLLRFLAKSVCFFAGVKVERRISPGFDISRTSFLVCNHVNVFDAFVLYAVVPQFFRGLELESHFKVPFYGWLMRWAGNIPVADRRGSGDIKRTFRLTKEALDQNISLLIFPEGSRTMDGRVGKFNDGAFVMARMFACPIVPVSIVGSFEFKRKGDWMLRPSRIVVHFHDTIETKGLAKDEIDDLRDRVRSIVAGPIDAYYEARSKEKPSRAAHRDASTSL